MTSTHVLFGSLIFALAILGALVTHEIINENRSAPTDPVACTMEAMICPDGTAVGRVGPNCEFAECPRL